MDNRKDETLSLYHNRSRIRVTKDPKVSLYFLIDTFSFPIGLGVIGSGKGEFIAKKFS